MSIVKVAQQSTQNPCNISTNKDLDGIECVDVHGKKWTFGGVIFSSSNSIVAKAKTNDRKKYIVKITEKDSAMMFREKHFYIKACKNKKIPETLLNYIGFGNFMFAAKSFRFILFEHFGQSLYDFASNNTVTHKHLLAVVSGILQAFEYIHKIGYCHNDVKPANILIHFKNYLFLKQAISVKLVDFGLCVNFKKKDSNFLQDKRLSQNGTFLYCSLETHKGYFSALNDLHSFVFTIIDLLDKKIPWEKKNRSLNRLHVKEIYLANKAEELFKFAFENEEHVFLNAFKYIFSLDRNSEVNYDKLYLMFHN